MLIKFEKLTRNICSILINRPLKRNALNLDTIKELNLALQRFDNDNSLYVAILGGVGGNFSSGYDLNEMIDLKTAMPKIEHIQQMLWPIGTRLSDKKITIAAIEGHAAGFGYELALKCDFRVAERDSRMGFMNRRFGIPIMNGGTVLLPKLVGYGNAKELIATGKAQLAPEALEKGVINYISDVGCAIGRSLNLARCLAKFDQEAMLHDVKSLSSINYNNDIELMKLERKKSICYLQKCQPLEMVRKFLLGELGRHGSFDMGNLMQPEPEVTL